MRMETEDFHNAGGLRPEYQGYRCQKCFVGHSREAEWRDDILSACAEVLPEFNLEPWYAADHFEPTKPLRDMVVELIANARYGIYDLSSWQDRSGEWHLPRNVFIELGMAIVLNRPALLLRHTSNKALPLPACLQGVGLLEFAGETTLKRTLEERLPQWFEVPPERDWLNRFCIFGNRVCSYREIHPRSPQWGRESLRCHISDGLFKESPRFQKAEREEIRGILEDVLDHYDELELHYLDELLVDGGQFILCSLCQTARLSPLAVYRILPQTSADIFIAIGMSIALETFFEYKIPKMLLVRQEQDLPSLLRGYQVVEAVNSSQVKTKLESFIPGMIDKIEETVGQPKLLALITSATSLLERAQQHYPRSRQIAEAWQHTQAVQLAIREEIQALLQDAETAMAEGSFSEAEQKYQAVLELDSRNTEALAELALARESASLLQEVDSVIAQAYQELKRYALNRAYESYQRACQLDTRDWRADQLNQLKSALDGVERDCRDYQATLLCELEQGMVQRPDQMDEWVEKYRQVSLKPDSAEVAHEIERARKCFLQQHYNFLGSELDAIERFALLGEPQECLARLRQIWQIWEPILSDRARRALWPNIPLFDLVEERVYVALELMQVCETAAPLAQELERTLRFVQEVMESGDNYEAAIESAGQCLAERPPNKDPVYGILRPHYNALEQLEVDLQRAWDICRSTQAAARLNQARDHILLEEHSEAKGMLESILLESLSPEDKDRWLKLYQAVQDKVRESSDE